MPPLDLLPVFNTQPGATLLLSPDWVIVGASDDYLAATLTERDGLVGQFIFDAFPDNPDTPEANAVANVRASLQQVMATRQPHEMAPQHYDVPDPARPGRFVERHWLPRHTPVLDAAGQVQFVIQSVQDITARRSAERALRESQAQEQAAHAVAEQQRQRFLEVLTQMPAFIAVYQGPDHIYQFVNPAYQRLFPHRSFLGRPFREGTPEAEALGVVALFDQVYRTGEPVYLREMEGWFDFHGNGQPVQVFLNLSLHPLRDVQGRIDGVLDFTYDVSEQVRVRRQVEQLNEAAETRVAERTQALAQAQAETESQRRRLHQLVAEAPALIASLRGPEHVVELANEGFRAIFGGRELVGKTYRQAVPELEGQPFFGLLDAVYRTGETYYGIDQPVTLDRTNSGRLEHTFFTYTYQATRDAQGQIEGILIFAYEVTEQVRARQEREAQRQQLHDLFMQAPAPIVVLDGPELVYQVVNPAYQRIFPGRELLGKPLFAALPELTDTDLPALFGRVYRTGETYVAQELPLRLARRADGPLEDLHFTFTYQARRNAQHEIDGALVFAYEVTDQVLARRRLEASAAELRESEARFRTLADTAPNIVWNLNPDGSVRYVNKFCLEFLGITLAEFTAHNWGPYLLPEDVAPTQQILAQAIGERTLFSMEHRMRRHDGQYRWLQTQGGPSYLPGGELYGYVGSAIDITDLKQVNEQLVRTNADLDNFIYTASHDLKAPISNIEGLLLALEHELPAAARVDDVPVMLDMMQGAVERFKHTIAHLTDVSRLQKEHAQSPDQVPLAAVIDAVRLDLTPLLHESRARLDVDVQACPVVNFSEKNLRSVVYNLLSNALKYRHPDRAPAVRIACRPEDGYLVLEVADNGLGVDLSRGEQQLFAMFQRLHTHVEGTGIGLYMVKKMVENARGRIEVKSQLGVGSTFTVYFPR